MLRGPQLTQLKQGDSCRQWFKVDRNLRENHYFIKRTEIAQNLKKRLFDF